MKAYKIGNRYVGSDGRACKLLRDAWPFDRGDEIGDALLVLAHRLPNIVRVYDVEVTAILRRSRSMRPRQTDCEARSMRHHVT